MTRKAAQRNLTRDVGEKEVIFKRIVQALLLLMLLVNCMLLPGLYVELRDYFDPVMQEVNEGHFSFHPASLIFHSALALLPLFTLLTLLGYRRNALACSAIVAYVPAYFIYGNYIVTPRGFHASHLHTFIIAMVSVIIALIYFAHWILLRESELPSDNL